MPDSRLVPTPAAPDLPTRTILVNGSVLAVTYRIASIRVSHAAHKVPEAEIVLLDGDVSEQTFTASDAADLIPGVEIEIKAGYHGEEETIFKGMIIKQGVRVLQGQSSITTVVARHKIFKTTLNRKNNSFKDKKDSEIIEELLTGDKDVDATSIKHKHVVQPYCSDWDFLNLRAEANGMFVLPRATRIDVKKPNLDTDPVLSLYYGSSIIEFEAEMDARNCFSEVKVNGWSAADQKIINSSTGNEWNSKEPGNISADDAASAMGNESLELFWHGDTVTGDLDVMAKAVMIRRHLSKIRGRARCIGFATIWPGDLLDLNGVGDRFKGKAFVTGVSHSIREGRWDTDIQFGWDNKPYAARYADITAHTGEGFVPAVKGLHVGIVAQLENDPLSEFRVLIKLPTYAGADEAIWARMAAFDAGNERGSYFRPYVGDEVIVGFIEDNPLHAVILGCLHSSKNASPITPADDNYKKGFYSREKLKWEIDEEKKEMLFEVPDGNKILISQDQKGITLEDQNGNKIVMNDSGIEISSSKDIKIKASGDIKLEGTNAEIVANAQYKASGSSGAEISSNGTTSVKGSMVNIN